MKYFSLLLLLGFVVPHIECGLSSLFSGDKAGYKDSVVVDVHKKGLILKDKTTRAKDWELQGNWKSEKDYAQEFVGMTSHSNYILQCYKPKVSGNSRLALFYSYIELLEVEVTECMEAAIWKSIRIQPPQNGYHQISVLSKDKCIEYQVNMEASVDNSSGKCHRNAGSADWEKIG